MQSALDQAFRFQQFIQYCAVLCPLSIIIPILGSLTTNLAHPQLSSPAQSGKNSHDSLSCCHVMLSYCHMSSDYVDHWDMLNNFCFHVYAQKLLFMIVCHAVMVSCHAVMLSCCHMSSVYVDHWDMLNNFCFHVYAQN